MNGVFGRHRGNEPLIGKRLPIVLHEFTDCAQRPCDETAVVGDTLAIHHARVQRLRVGYDDVLGAICREQVSGPVSIWILVQRLVAELASFDLRVELLR